MKYFIFMLSMLISIASLAEEYKPWNEGVFNYVKEQYGEAAEKRMHLLHNMVLKNQDKSSMEKLEIVNNALNTVPWIADANHWKKADY